MTTTIEPLLLSVDQAATVCGVGRSIFYGLLLRGEVPSLKIGRRRLVSRSSLEEYISRLQEEQETRDLSFTAAGH